MSRHLLALGFLGLAAAAPMASAQSAPDPAMAVNRAFTAPAGAVQAYAYDFVSETDGEDGGVVRGRYDPSKPKGQRYTIFEATAKDATIKKVDERFEKRGDGGEGLWCDQAFGGADGPVAQRTDASGATVYEFTPLGPKNSPRGESRDLYRAMRTELVMDPASAQMKSYRASLQKPVRMMVVATANSAVIAGQCAPGPNGRMFAARTEIQFSGSGMGQKISRRIVQTISNLTPVG